MMEKYARSMPWTGVHAACTTSGSSLWPSPGVGMSPVKREPRTKERLTRRFLSLPKVHPSTGTDLHGGFPSQHGRTDPRLRHSPAEASLPHRGLVSQPARSRRRSTVHLLDVLSKILVELNKPGVVVKSRPRRRQRGRNERRQRGEGDK